MLSQNGDTILHETAQGQSIQWPCPDDALPGTYTAFAISISTDIHGEQQRASSNLYITSAPGIDAFDIYLPLVVKNTP